MKPETAVIIEQWQSNRLPVGHHLRDRWSIMHRGRAIITCAAASDAIETAASHGWTVARIGPETEATS